MAKSSKAAASPSITEQMTELSELVEQLEDPEIELEAALVLYEKGVKLSGSIQKILESAEQRVAQVAADGSLLEDQKTPAEYDYNVDVTRRVVDMAHACGVSVEGELGCLGSLESGTAGEEDGVGAEGVLSMEQMLTDPEQAADFVQKTGVYALAIVIGTSHGAYKFSRPPTGDILAIEQVKAIHSRLPNTHLVMHGSSSVPQELLAEINQYGGEIPETYGVPVAEIQQGIKHGVRKVNIDTDLRLASTAAIRKFLARVFYF